MGEERKLILEMIKDGKITAEEGKELLQALGEEAKENYSEGNETKDKEKNSYEDHKESGWGIFDALKSMINFGDITGPVYDFEEEYTHRFSSSNVSAKINTKTGTVVLKGWDKEECFIKLTKKVKGLSEDKARELAQSYQVLRLYESSIDTENIKNKHLNVSYEIYLPKNIVLNLDTSSVNGRVNITDITIDHGKISSVNGKILIENVEGSSLNISGVNGLIDINTKVDTVKCSTVNGSIKIRDTNQNQGNVKASTVNGPVKIGLPRGVTGVKIDSSSVNGRTRVEHPDLRIVSQSGKVMNRSCEVISDGPTRRYYNTSAVNGSLTICEINEL